MILKKFFYLLKNNKNKWKSEDEIKIHQLNLLKKIVSHAYATVPYYRKLFQDANLLPKDISNLDDLKKIPITTKKDLIKLKITKRLSSTYRPEMLINRRTGGTTGQPIDIFYENSLEDLRAASLFRMYLSNGYRFTDKIANMGFYPIRPKFISKLGFLKRVGIPFDMSLNDQVELLQSEKPQVLEGYPSRLSCLSKELLENNITEIQPKLILTNSETLTQEMHNNIVNAFGILPTNIYETWEFGTVAWECPNHEGFHTEADRLIVEILPNDNPNDRDIAGEIIVTDLYNKAMPFIRYATGDIGSLAIKQCSCGRTFPMIKEIQGRVSEKIYLSDGSATHVTTLINELAKGYEGLAEYQFIQNCIGELEMRIVADKKFTHHDEEELKSRITNSFQLKDVAIKKVRKIDKTIVGKRNPFISNVSN